LTLHLAVAAERRGQSVAVIDLDPQASSAGWKDSRAGESPVVVTIPHSRLTHALETAKAAGATLALIDTAPHSEGAAMAAARAADLVLIPCRAGILDLRAIGTTAEVVKLAGKAAFVVLNAVPPRATNMLADAREAVTVHGLEVAPMAIQQRAAFAHALIAGQTAEEYEPEGKAARKWPRFTNGLLPNSRVALLLNCWQKGILQRQQLAIQQRAPSPMP
jgi:chromosome partitioning protein